MSYWGKDALCNVRGWKIQPAIRQLEDVGLQMSGIPIELWMPLGGEEWGKNGCSCIKSAPPGAQGGAPDVICLSCYGVGTLGGYHKYGYNYIEHGSTMASLTYNPAQVMLNVNFRPFRLQLVDGVNSAYITSSVSTSFMFYPGGIEYHVDSYLRDTNNAVAVEYNIGGLTWYPIAQIVNLGDGTPKNISFRIRLQRAANERSPLFEFLRVRSKKFDLTEHFIRMSRTRSPDDITKDKPGLLDTQTGISYWTVIDFEIISRSFGRITDPTNPYYDKRFEMFNFTRSWFDQTRFRQIFDARLISREREIIERIF